MKQVLELQNDESVDIGGANILKTVNGYRVTYEAADAPKQTGWNMLSRLTTITVGSPEDVANLLKLINK